MMSTSVQAVLGDVKGTGRCGIVFPSECTLPFLHIGLASGVGKAEQTLQDTTSVLQLELERTQTIQRHHSH